MKLTSLLLLAVMIPSLALGNEERTIKAAELEISKEYIAEIRRENDLKQKLLPVPVVVCDDNTWTTFDWTMQIIGTTLIVIDTMQTAEFTSRGVPETNPILGSHPSRAHIGLFALTGTALFWGGAYILPRPYRTVLQSGVIGIEGYAVSWNAFRVKSGLRAPW